MKCEPTSPALLPRAQAVLRFLFDAHPLPVATRTLARGFFSLPGGGQKSSENRTLRLLDQLRKRDLVVAGTGLTVGGRPPSYWGLTKGAIEQLLELHVVTPDECGRRVTGHKALANLLRRQHDLVVLGVEALLHEFCRHTPRFKLSSACHDRRAWRGTGDSAIAPDLTAVVEAGGSRALLLVECQSDRPGHKAISEGKLPGYRAYLNGGGAARDYGCSVARLIFIAFSPDATSIDLRNNQAETLVDSGGLDAVARVATNQDIWRSGLGGAVFLRPGDIRKARATGGDDFASAKHLGNARRAVRDSRFATLPLTRWFE